MQTGDCEFYLSGLSGTVLEIVTTWKAVVGFRRNEKDEKAVLLGLYSGREERKMRFNEYLVSKLRSDTSPLEENLKIRKVKTKYCPSDFIKIIRTLFFPIVTTSGLEVAWSSSATSIITTPGERQVGKFPGVRCVRCEM